MAGALPWPAGADPDDPRTWPPDLLNERNADLADLLGLELGDGDREAAARWRDRWPAFRRALTLATVGRRPRHD